MTEYDTIQNNSLVMDLQYHYHLIFHIMLINKTDRNNKRSTRKVERVKS